MAVSQKEKVPIQSQDGVSSRITIFRNSNLEAAVLALMPAMGVKATFYEPFVHALVREGLNVVTADTLRKAQANPEQYRDLIVRVAGYSDYFCDLGKTLQDEIIARTEQRSA